MLYMESLSDDNRYIEILGVINLYILWCGPINYEMIELCAHGLASFDVLSTTFV